jgi:DNA polymerase-4
MKTILHVDMDAFFVSVEEIYHPELKGKPVVVGGRPDQRGVVSAASYAARKYGVHSAMPLRTAYKLCPQAIFVEGHPSRYKEHSQMVWETLSAFSPQVQMASIDEAYVDLTGSERLHGPPLRAAHALHEKIRARTKLNCSIGVSTSRLVAKICSDQAKPNGLLYIVPGMEARFLAPLDVRKIPGVGKVTEKALAACGIRRIGDLALLDEAFLEERFGKWGLALAGKARGLDAGGWLDGEIGGEEQPKSISHEHTFGEDLSDPEQLESTLARLSEMVASRLREHRLYARTVQLKLRYKDFSTYTRAHTLDHATQLDIEIIQHSRRLFRKHWDQRPVRLLGVAASGFESAEGQLPLLEEEKHERWKKALSAVDRIRGRYGSGSLSVASAMKGSFRERVHETPTDLPGRHPKKEA